MATASPTSSGAARKHTATPDPGGDHERRRASLLAAAPSQRARRTRRSPATFTAKRKVVEALEPLVHLRSSSSEATGIVLSRSEGRPPTHEKSLTHTRRVAP